MKKKFVSFRYRLFATFLLVSLIPLLLCTASLVQVARLRLDAETARQSEEELSALVARFGRMSADIVRVSAALDGD